MNANPIEPEGPAAFPPGVRPLDHTADIGMTVEADSLAELFDLAARGTMAFLAGEDGGGGPGEASEESITLEARDAGLLLVAWLRELLYLAESRGLCYRRSSIEELGETRLRARVHVVPCPAAVSREIKGVTYHGLAVEAKSDGWTARVIFDV